MWQVDTILKCIRISFLFIFLLLCLFVLLLFVAVKYPEVLDNYQEKEIQEKWTKDMSRQLTKRANPMSNNIEKECSNSLALRKSELFLHPSYL